MADLESNLRRHYEGQQLPDERARAILAAGRAAAVRRTARRRWLMGMAAAVAVGVGAAGVWRSNRGRITAQDAVAAVQAHFAAPGYTMAAVSADPAELERWVREHGGPERIEVPATMRGLQSFGCQVLEARGEKVFLLCFFIDSTPVPPGAMPLKQEMVVTAPDGTMMKKSRPLVHLVIAARAAFRDAPAPGARVRMAADGEWNLEAWSRGELVYLVAANVPAEKIAELARAL
ncbi:MAG: hypothetical protein JNK23_06235 [Opitutaceae bacterium]|nr:hypothetical protein [Opitutaceae bacterium]